MIKVEGYKAFHGKMKISPVSGREPFVLECDWLYKPDTGCWYGNGSSFGEKICEITEDMTIGTKIAKVKASRCITFALNYYCEACHSAVNERSDKYCATCGSKLEFEEGN